MAELDEGASHATVDRSLDTAGSPVIAIAGEVDMSNVASIEAALEALLAERPARLVFDLSELSFIDSSGIAVLLRAAGKTEQLELRNPSTIVRRVIAATGLSNVLRVES
jgi:anti-sigma B factor antagonist